MSETSKEFKTRDEAIHATSSEFPWVVQRDRDDLFEITRAEGPHPKGALVYQKPAPVDLTKLEFNTLGQAVDATSKAFPNVIRKASGKFMVSAIDAKIEGATLVFRPIKGND